MGSGDCEVKIKDIINEAWGFGTPDKPGVLGHAVRDIIGDVNYEKMLTQKAAKRARGITPTAPITQPQEPAEPVTTQTTGVLSPGVTVVKSNPLTLRYQKRDFLLNKQDVWVMLGPQPKAASAEMQDFLNSELEKL